MRTDTMADEQILKGPLGIKKEPKKCEWCGKKTEQKTVIRGGGEWEWACSDCTIAYGKGLTVGRVVGKEEVRNPILNALGIESR